MTKLVMCVHACVCVMLTNVHCLLSILSIISHPPNESMPVPRAIVTKEVDEK